MSRLPQTSLADGQTSLRFGQTSISSKAGGGTGIPPGPIPANTVAPVITGSYVVGQTLTCSQGTWDNAPTGYAYQWRKDGAPIGGATASTFLLTVAELDAYVDCRVTATNENGSASVNAVGGTVTAAPAFAWSNIGALFNGGAVDGIMIDLTDKTTLFQGASGETPVVNNGDPVGLALDQHKWGGLTLAAYRAAQPELNSAGVNSSQWTASNGNVVAAGGNLRITATGASAPVAMPNGMPILVSSGRWYEISMKMDAATGSGMSVRVGSTNGGTQYFQLNLTTGSAGATFRRFFKATSSNLYVDVVSSSGSGNYTEWSIFSVKEIDGHHATQTGTMRPTWDATEGAVRLTAASSQRFSHDYFNALNNNFLAAWGKPYSTNNMAFLGVRASSKDATLRVYSSKSTALLGVSGGTLLELDGGAPANTNVSIVATENGSVKRLFTNGGGKLAATMNGGLVTSADGYSAPIGAYNNSGSTSLRFDGIIRRIVCGQIALDDAACVELDQNMTAA